MLGTATSVYIVSNTSDTWPGMEAISSKLNRIVLAFSLIAVLAFILGIAILGLLSLDLPRGQQAQILATTIGALGTLLLALATFINIRQSNRRLELQEKDREKTLVLDELSNLICPAIEALERNLRDVRESTKSGCVFEWVYIDEPKSYNAAQGPVRILTSNQPSLARLGEDDPELARDIKDHYEIVKEIGEEASKLHEELRPEVESRLREYGVEEIDKNLEVVTNAILQEVDSFKESTGLSEFWEDNRDSLIKYAQVELESDLSDIKDMEEQYIKKMESLVEALRERKLELKQEFNISEDEIVISEEGEPSLL